jgi:hypothetical protein
MTKESPTPTAVLTLEQDETNMVNGYSEKWEK